MQGSSLQGGILQSTIYDFLQTGLQGTDELTPIRFSGPTWVEQAE
jgi:hypothetical protein